MSLSLPSEIVIAMTRAENSCFKILCNELDLKPKKNAFIAVNPSMVDIMVFSLGRILNGQVLHSGNAEALHFEATADLWYRKRETAQLKIMEILCVTPFDEKKLDGTNLATFRVATNGIGIIDLIDVEVASSKEKIPCWHSVVTFDVVFALGKREKP